MIRLFNVVYPTRVLLLLVGEGALIISAFALAVLVRYRQDTLLYLNYQGGFGQVGLAAGVCLICLYYFDLYDSMIISNQREVLIRIVQVLGTTCIVVAPVHYLFPAAAMEATVFVLGISLSGVFLALWRKMFMAINASRRFARRALLLGTGPQAKSLSTEIERRSEWGVSLVGYVGDPPTSPAAMNGLPRLGGIEDLNVVVGSSS